MPQFKASCGKYIMVYLSQKKLCVHFVSTYVGEPLRYILKSVEMDMYQLQNTFKTMMC